MLYDGTKLNKMIPPDFFKGDDCFEGSIFEAVADILGFLPMLL